MNSYLVLRDHQQSLRVLQVQIVALRILQVQHREVPRQLAHLLLQRTQLLLRLVQLPFY